MCGDVDQPVDDDWVAFDCAASVPCLPCPGYLKLLDVCAVDLLKFRVVRASEIAVIDLPFAIAGTGIGGRRGGGVSEDSEEEDQLTKTHEGGIGLGKIKSQWDVSD